MEPPQASLVEAAQLEEDGSWGQETAVPDRGTVAAEVAVGAVDGVRDQEPREEAPDLARVPPAAEPRAQDAPRPVRHQPADRADPG